MRAISLRVCFGMLATALTLSAGLHGEDTVFEDFEAPTYQGWTIEGDCFGDQPARGTLPRQQLVSGFLGKQLVNTFREGDERRGQRPHANSQSKRATSTS